MSNKRGRIEVPTRPHARLGDRWLLPLVLSYVHWHEGATVQRLMQTSKLMQQQVRAAMRHTWPTLTLDARVWSVMRGYSCANMMRFLSFASPGVQRLRLWDVLPTEYYRRTVIMDNLMSGFQDGGRLDDLSIVPQHGASHSLTVWDWSPMLHHTQRLKHLHIVGRCKTPLMRDKLWSNLRVFDCLDTHVSVTSLAHEMPSFLPPTLEWIAMTVDGEARGENARMDFSAQVVPAFQRLVRACPQLSTLRIHVWIIAGVGVCNPMPSMDKALGIVADALGRQLKDLRWTTTMGGSLGVAGVDAVVQCNQLTRLEAGLHTLDAIQEERLVRHLPHLNEWLSHGNVTQYDDGSAFFLQPLIQTHRKRPGGCRLQRLHLSDDSHYAHRTDFAFPLQLWLQLLQASTREWRQLPDWLSGVTQELVRSPPAADLLRLVAYTPQLRSVVIRSEDPDVRDLFPVLQQLRQLRWLELVHNNITGELLAVVHDHLHELRSLSVVQVDPPRSTSKTNDPILTDQRLLALAKGCPHLLQCTIDLFDACGSSLSAAGLVAMLRAASRLRRLVLNTTSGCHVEHPTLPLPGIADERPLFLDIQTLEDGELRRVWKRGPDALQRHDPRLTLYE